MARLTGPLPGRLGLGSTPARLRLLLAASVAACLAWGAVASLAALHWTSAANTAVSSTGPLSFTAQQVYRSLSDADATEANDYLTGVAPTASLTRVHDDVSVSAVDVAAIKAGDPTAAVQGDLATLAAGIPTYANLTGKADAFNRASDVVGAAWLSEASSLMRTSLLPAARDLYQREDARLRGDYGQATGLPYLITVLAVALALGAAAFFGQAWLARRTRRLLNPGLAAACLLGLAMLAWLLSGFAAARSDLLAARDSGSTPAQALAQAEVTALAMHSDESLTLIDRDGAQDAAEADFDRSERTLSSALVTAQAVGGGSPGSGSAVSAAHLAQAWFSVHARVYQQDAAGSYQSASGLAVGGSTTAFDQVDAALTAGLAADQAAFTRQSAAGDDALGGLAAGAGLAGLLMGAACAWGVSRRIAEYG